MRDVIDCLIRRCDLLRSGVSALSAGISPRSITSRIAVTTYIFYLSGNDNLTSPTPGVLSPIWLAILCFEFHILIDNTSTYLRIDISVRVLYQSALRSIINELARL